MYWEFGSMFILSILNLVELLYYRSNTDHKSKIDVSLSLSFFQSNDDPIPKAGYEIASHL